MYALKAGKLYLKGDYKVVYKVCFSFSSKLPKYMNKVTIVIVGGGQGVRRERKGWEAGDLRRLNHFLSIKILQKQELRMLFDF